MKVKKNYCSGCGRNFFTESMFFEHRVGKYPSENAGVSTRRCLTDEEMLSKEWAIHMLDVTVYVDGNKTTTPMLTWVSPGQLEAREVKAERFKKLREIQLQK